MSEREVDARVEELTRGLRRMAAGLLEAASDHPDDVRARELSAAARILASEVLGRLDGDAVSDSPARRSEPEVQDAAPAAPSAVAETGSALEELVELYLPDYERRRDDNLVMTDPDLPYERWRHLHRVEFGRGMAYEDAPVWNDTVPSRGKAVVRGMTSKREVLRRLHHSYVTRRDLDSPEGELAVRVMQGCKAIERSRAIGDGDFVDGSDLGRKLEVLQWRALVVAAGRGEHARAQLQTQLRQLEVLAVAVLELDTAFRRRNSDPSPGARIARAAQGVKVLVRHWPPKAEEAVAEAAAESGSTAP
ncbi:hypothetical protein [Streptomyces sp. NBC_01304]|uniref:hypothetical protein n=1 Tax=Streptomyces sp. NBC_01304 TaxID=2903818 RepID=UPI002E11A1C4|nr:hypothetical protein OG430_03975 [Streptomyces sp. NBC_01304]